MGLVEKTCQGQTFQLISAHPHRIIGLNTFILSRVPILEKNAESYKNECCYTECRYAECLYNEFYLAECCYVKSPGTVTVLVKLTKL